MNAIFKLDPQVEAFEEHVFNTPLIQDVWPRYYWGTEYLPDHVYMRVAAAIGSSPCETNVEEAKNGFYEMLSKRIFIPGGRILAGAGTDKRVTLMNCYVNRILEDSMEGLMGGVSDLALTMQQGGGMGTAFETIRPKGAILRRTQSAASGILPFMDLWNASCKTIRSAGDRRGAMMATISDTHPDLPAFIVAKFEGSKSVDGHPLTHDEKRWSDFNVSVLISDVFKAAVDDDAEWPLYFSVPPLVRAEGMEAYDFVDDDGTQQYVYSVWKARDLWDLVTEHTYKYSDPGVIFIDRVNDLNNLSYCEEIRCTNPCGEQPLPPNATCNLGAINVSQCVHNPFTPSARVDWEMLAEAAKWGVRFLDNVIEVTGYPLEAQKEEEYNKRRIGLGIAGLGTLFSELGIRYGSHQSVQLAEKVMKTIALSAYDASIQLSEERGQFPLFDTIITECGFINARLDDERKLTIKAKGLRNGVVLTIAPVGTGAIGAGNISSGLEPDFAHEYDRQKREDNSTNFKTYKEKSYTKRFYEFCTGRTDIPDYMVTSMDLTVLEHIKVQGALQKWVDSSVSKTINVPEDISYEDFVEVYELAYTYGCKGCTTFRPTPDRLGILSVAKADASTLQVPDSIGRGDELEGSTYKLKWPSMSASMYVTINYKDGSPYEIFFASKDARYSDWMTGLTLMISSIMRSGIDPKFIPQELKQVISTHDTAWDKGKHYGSLVARIGSIIEQDFIKHGIIQIEGTIKTASNAQVTVLRTETPDRSMPRGEPCPDCGQPTVFHEEGCKKCRNCTYSAC